MHGAHCCCRAPAPPPRALLTAPLPALALFVIAICCFACYARVPLLQPLCHICLGATLGSACAALACRLALYEPVPRWSLTPLPVA